MTEQTDRDALTAGRVKTLRDVQKWAALAEHIGIPDSSPVEVDTVGQKITVTAWLAQATWPEAEEDDQ